MPKAEFGTTKWMSNKIKASGLQKLRWYCQMCQKQCRDENGFKCHRMSEGHQRMMQVFIQNPNKFMDEFSRDFEREFMRLMRTRYCRTRVLANSVYNNIVADRQHVHMNATIWVTLSEFVQYLGSTNKCRIELTPKGWYVEYIDHEELKRLELLQRRRKEELSQEEAKVKRLGELVEEAEKKGKFKQSVYTPLVRNEGEKVVIGRLRGTAKGETKGVSERPVNALQLLAMELKTEQSRERKRVHSLTCDAAAAPVHTSEKGKELSPDSNRDTVVGYGPIEGSCRKRSSAWPPAEARCEGVPATSASCMKSGSQGRSSIGGDDSYRRPANKQRRLLAMERLRIEEEQKKLRTAWLGERLGGNGQAAHSGRHIREGADRVDEGVSTAGDRPTHGYVKGKIVRTDDGQARENAGEVGERRSSSVEPPFTPPPHKYRDKDWWLSKGLIVKVLHKTLGEGQFYKQKGRVMNVENRYSGYVQMLDSGAVLRLDQKDLETVIPNIGGWIRVTLGVWRDHEGIIETVDVENYCVHVLLKSGPLFKSLLSARPFVVKHLPYEHVCRLERVSEKTR